MFYLEKDTTNKLSLDCVQVTTETVPFFFFFFKDEQTQDEFTGYLTRLNSGNNRFGEFDLILPTDFALPAGYYVYRVFENDNNVDTDFENMLVLEVGRCEVVATSEEINAYDAPDKIAKTYVNS